MTAVAPRRIVLALLLAFLVLAATANCPRNWETWPTESNQSVHVPCAPVVIAGRAECTGYADIPPGATSVVLEPAPESSAAVVREALREMQQRRGTP